MQCNLWGHHNRISLIKSQKQDSLCNHLGRRQNAYRQPIGCRSELRTLPSAPAPLSPGRRPLVLNVCPDRCMPCHLEARHVDNKRDIARSSTVCPTTVVDRSPPLRSGISKKCVPGSASPWRCTGDLDSPSPMRLVVSWQPGYRPR